MAMNRIPLYRRPDPWVTGAVALLGLLVIGAMVAWLWRPSKTTPAIPAPLAASAPVQVPSETVPASPAQARRALAVSGRWDRLSARDQAILAPLRDDWADLSFDQRLKWLDLSLRFPGMTLDEQQRVQERMAQWARMSSTERGAARLNFQEIRQLSQKERLEQWEAYQGLNPAERKELALKAQSATQAPVVPRRAEPSAPVPKSSGLAAESLASASTVARPVGGTLVQAPIGATTRLVTQVPVTAPPTPAGPRIAAPIGAVDPVTLLPQARNARSGAPAVGGHGDGSSPMGDDLPPAGASDAASAPPAAPSGHHPGPSAGTGGKP